MHATMSRHHNSNISPKQCGSSQVHSIDAPLPLVWSLIRRFDHPQGYKQFVKKCNMLVGDGEVGSVREVVVMSGMPARVSLERLDKLDDEVYVMKFSIIGGDHRLMNYRSTITVHEEEGGGGGGGGEGKTVVIESFVVDVPAGSNGEDTCSFVDTIVGCNLRSLARITQQMSRKIVKLTD